MRMQINDLQNSSALARLMLLDKSEELKEHQTEPKEMSEAFNDDFTLYSMPEEDGTRGSDAGPDTNTLTSPTAGVSRDDARSVTDFERVAYRAEGWLRMT